jgi:hypothetical protein
MSIFNEFNKKEKPVFTGIARAVGGFAFGTSGLTVGSGFAASGGAITLGDVTTNGYTYHVFDTANSPETFQVTDAGDGNGYVEVLLIGGGGGGGSRGGGGGAGAVRYLTLPISSTVTMPVSVGAGSAGGAVGNNDGTQGNNTTLVNPLGPTTYNASGGGAGGSINNGGGTSSGPENNGSGGGGGRDGPVAGGAGGTYGNAGGSPGGGAPHSGAGGGGGAMGEGGDATGPSPESESGGRGGWGVAYPGFGGPLISPPGSPNPRVPAPVRTAITAAGFYGAGGGGGSGGQNAPFAPGVNYAVMGVGGIGGKDSGANSPPGVTGGVDLTGSGGGGGGDNPPTNAGGDGGDGVCIVRYKKRTSASPFGSVSGPDGNTSLKAVGGVIEFTSSKVIHYFVQPGTFTTLEAISGAKILMVGGGAGGGGRHGGGGGAGQLNLLPSATLPAQNYTITIGKGGDGAFKDARGGTGGNTSIAYPGPNSISAPGGGGGGSYPTNTSANSGGSGGGGGGSNGATAGSADNGTTSGSPTPSPIGTVIRYGGSGGVGRSGGPDWRNGGGGGGAAQNGEGESTSTADAGPGGDGLQVPIGDTSFYWAGGGGGGRWNGGPSGVSGGEGGQGGGGAGGQFPGGSAKDADGNSWLSPIFPGSTFNGGQSEAGRSAGGSAVFGTGGGGGGQGQGLPYSSGNPQGRAGTGAPGIVIVEYPI